MSGLDQREPLRAVIVGCGRIAGGFNTDDDARILTHVVAYRRLGAQVAGCCDIDAEKAVAFARRWDIPRHGSDVRALLHALRPDIVSICAPASAQPAIVDAVIDCDSVRAVIVEKPLATSAREAERLCSVLQRWGRPVVVNYLRAFDPFYRSLAEEYQHRRWGSLHELTIRYSGRAWANASHFLDRVLDMLGEPERAHRHSGSTEAPLFELAYANGGPRVVFLPVTGPSYSVHELDFMFERARVRVVDSERRAEQFTVVPHPDFHGYFTLVPEPSVLTACPGVDGIRGAIAELLEAARTGALRTETLPRAAAVSRILESVGAG